MNLGEIAKQLGCRLEGDPQAEITGVTGIEEARAGQITFLANLRYRSLLRTTLAAAVIAGDTVEVDRQPGLPPLALLRSANPYLDFARAIELFHSAPKYAPGIHPTAVIAPGARIGANAHIGPYCFVDEDVQVGRDAVLHSFVSLYRDVRIGDDFFAHSHVAVREGCRIGNRVLLQNGVVIGADGFGFARKADGNWHKIFPAGITVLEDDVEVQANSCVDRATLGETLVENDVKIDDLVLVGHGSIVGAHTVLCGQVGLAGSTEIGKSCMIGGQVGSAGHLKVGDGAMVTAQSGIHNDVPAGAAMAGYPAVGRRDWARNSAAINQLPELVKRVRQLESEIESLKSGAER